MQIPIRIMVDGFRAWGVSFFSSPHGIHPGLPMPLSIAPGRSDCPFCDDRRAKNEIEPENLASLDPGGQEGEFLIRMTSLEQASLLVLFGNVPNGEGVSLFLANRLISLQCFFADHDRGDHRTVPVF
jgi:hypothetical protein